MKIEARVSTKGQLTKPFVFLAKELGFEPMSQWKAFRNNTDIQFRWTECWTDTHREGNHSEFHMKVVLGILQSLLKNQ